MFKIFNKFKVNQKQQNLKIPYNIQSQPLTSQPMALNFNHTRFDEKRTSNLLACH